MTATVVPYEDPEQREITTEPPTNPFRTDWFLPVTIDDIPEDSVGWLVAQGWKVESVTYLDVTVPPTPRYSMSKDSMQNLAILNALLGEWTFAYRVALTNNEDRYNDVVFDWTDMLVSSQEHFVVQVEAQNAHALEYLKDMDDYMKEVDALLKGNETKLIEDVAVATTALTALDAKLTGLEDNYDASFGIIDKLLTAQEGYLGDFLGDFIDELAELDTNYTAHLTLMIQPLLGDADTDLETFLDDQAIQLGDIEQEYKDHESELDVLLTAANGFLATITNDIGDVLTDIDADYGDVDTDVTNLLADGVNALSDHTADYNKVLATLETDYTDVDTEVTDLLADGVKALDTHTGDFNTVLATLETDYTDVDTEVTDLLADGVKALTDHTADYNPVLATLDTDYATHAPIATGFLDDLGATELARINEKFAASLSTQLQQLMDRGLYSSAVAVDFTARNTRDKNEEIAALNDRLNREKFENQHRLYGQQTAMRTGTMAGKDRIHTLQQESLSYQAAQVTGLHTQQTAMRTGTMNGKERMHTLQQELLRYQAAQVTGLHGFQQSMRDRTMAGKDRIHGLQQEVLRYQATQITGLHGLQQSMRDRTMNGKQALDALRLANNRLHLELKSKLYSDGQAMRRVLIEEAARLQQLQQAITQWKTGQRDRLFEQIQNIVTQNLAGLAQQHTAQQTVSAATMSERNTLLLQLQDAVKGFLDGKAKYAALTAQNASTLTEQRHRMIVELMAETQFREAGGQKKHTETMELMEYQLNTRNQLLVGLYGFVERREDVGPSIADLARITTSLADSGGGWLTP